MNKVGIYFHDGETGRVHVLPTTGKKFAAFDFTPSTVETRNARTT